MANSRARMKRKSATPLAHSNHSRFRSLDWLEPRQLMAVNVVAIQKLTPITGGQLEVSYSLTENAALTSSLNFNFYRSADPVFDASDKSIGSVSATDQTSLSTGSHTIRADLGQAMRPDPSRPYVIVVGRPTGLLQETDTADNFGVIRKYTIGVISHGGIQGSHINIPQWEAKIGWKMQDYGYDAVIPFNWTGASHTPGAAAKQGPRLAQKILDTVATLPQNASIDLDYIGHSEGSVVVSQAALWLQKHPSTNLTTGYQRMTLLDPHAANPEAPNNAESVAGGIKGWLTKRLISWYKGNSRDPIVQIPTNINEADVYYQRTPITVNPVNGGLYNLLGQVPVIGTARYIQLNSPGISHSGGGGVYTWFYFNALPAFQTGNQPVNPSILETKTVAAQNGYWNRKNLITTDTRATWSGLAAPSAEVRLYLASASSKPDNSRPIASTLADSTGQWHLQPSKSMKPGSYQVNIRSFLSCGLPRENLQIMPTIRMGKLTIPSPRASIIKPIPALTSPLSIPQSLNKNGIGMRLTNGKQTFDPKHHSLYVS
jgi:hypothetical protein